MLRLSGQGPLHLQLYRAIQQDILNGSLGSGDQLPASRELAKSLEISRNVVVQSYEQLAAEGYIYSRQGAGSYVSDVFIERKNSPQKIKSSDPATDISRNARAMIPMWQQYRRHFDQKSRPRIDFQYGNVGGDHRLEKQLKANLKNQGAGIHPSYQHPAGWQKLKEVIAKYVGQYRGVVCNADQIVITNGSQEALTLVAQMLLNPGDEVVMEEPGYRGATQAFRSVSAVIQTVAVDQSGLCTDLLPHHSNARLVYATPSHQFPTGGVMPLERRLALIEWADKHQAYILEDDYDSEFRYEGTPIESIQGMDSGSRTIYMGTFSKIISPVLRTGFLVLPESLVEPACAIKWTYNRHSPLVIQKMLAEYLDSIHFTRHLRRMRKRYSERRAVLIESLEHYLGNQIVIHGTNAGIHLLVWLDLPVEHEQALIEMARGKGIGIHTATNLYETKPQKIGLLLGYSNLSNAEIREGVKIIADCIQQF